MELKNGEDVAAFALKFQRLAKEVGVAGQKTVRKYSYEHAPGLVSHIQNDLLRREVALEDVVHLPRNFSKNQAFMGVSIESGVVKDQQTGLQHQMHEDLSPLPFAQPFWPFYA